MYRTRAIITRGLYTFHTLFEDHFFVFKELFFEKFCPYVWLVSNQERVMMARVQYLVLYSKQKKIQVIN